MPIKIVAACSDPRQIDLEDLLIFSQHANRPGAKVRLVRTEHDKTVVVYMGEGTDDELTAGVIATMNY